jgi:ribonuclease D
MSHFPEFYITNDQGLGLVLNLIRQAKIVSIDTEFTRETTYYPILSLIQISVKDGDEQKSFIVDCLADIDLMPLYQIIADNNITKILHSSLQDLQIFYQKSNIQPNSIADTQIMANFCGLGFNVGYSALVNNFFQTEIDKSQQRSNWQKRPLSEKQTQYALSDVFYLEEIYEKLLKILEEKGRKEWYLEEVKRFSKNATIQLDENLFKNFNFKRKTPKQISQIKKLILWREKWAQKFDVPRQHFIKDSAIERIVIFNDLDLKFDSLMINEIKEILNQEYLMEELNSHQDHEERNFFMTAQQKKIYKEAKIIISKIALKENFKEQFLITSSGLKSLICNQKEVDRHLCKWRYQLFGESLKKLISN